MTDPTPELPVINVPLAELEHIVLRVHRSKLGSVLSAYRAGIVLPPIWLSRPSPTAALELQDGNHRLHGARLLGHATVRAILATGAEQIQLAEQLWSIGAIGVSDAAARSAVRRHREFVARCGLAHLFPDFHRPQQEN